MNYLSVEQLMKVLGVSRCTAYALTKRSDFPASRIGRRIVVSETALQEWLSRGGTAADSGKEA